MSEQVLVVPVSGFKVRDPETKKYLSESGEQRVKNFYWIRRELAGEVKLEKIEIKSEKKNK